VIPDASTLLQSAVEGFDSQPEDIPREHELMQVVIGNTAYRLHVGESLSRQILEKKVVPELALAFSVVTMLQHDNTGFSATPHSTSPEEPEATLSIYLSLIGSESIPVYRSEHASIFLGLKSNSKPSATVGNRVCWIMRDTMEWEFNCDADWFRES
jgi:hypothetical protein